MSGREDQGDDPSDRDLWDLDRDVRRHIAESNPEIASLSQIGLRLLLSGLRHIDGPAMQPNEMVMAMAASQILNSLRSAVGLAFGGYAIQSLAVTRLAAEYWLLFEYMRLRPDKAQGWLDFSKEPPKSAGEFAMVVFSDDAASSDVFRDLRQVLHRFAHQDNLGLAAVYKEAKASTVVIQVGSDPDPHYLNSAAYTILLVMALALDSISRAYGIRDATWSSSVARYLPAVIEWQDRIAAEEEQRLRKMGLISP